MAGPILVGQLLLMHGQDPMVIATLGIALVVFGLVFALPSISGGGRVRTAEGSS
jgi:hypothetical protein